MTDTIDPAPPTTIITPGKSNCNSGKTNPIKLMIHGEDGSFPYLTPFLLKEYFSPDSSTVQNHLLLGVAVKDCCVAPVYRTVEATDDSENRGLLDGAVNSKKSRKKLKRSKSSAIKETDVNGTASHANDDDATKSYKNHTQETAYTTTDNNNQLKPNNNGKSDNNKPIGFTFEPKSLSQHLRIQPGFHTVLVPSFDLLDDVQKYCSSLNHSRRGKQQKRKQASNSHSRSSSSSITPSLPITVSSTNAQTSVWTPNGMQKLSTELYASVTSNMMTMEDTEKEECRRTIAVVGLYDQVNEGEGKKRKVVCATRNKAWLDTCISQWERLGAKDDNDGTKENVHTNMSANSNPTNSSKNFSPKVWAPVVCQVEERCWKDSLTALVPKRHSSRVLDGVVLIGWHRLHCREKRVEMLRQCVSAFGGSDTFGNKDACAKGGSASIVILATTNVQQILDAARNGANVIGTALPALLARSKHAFVFNILGWETEINREERMDSDVNLNSSSCNATSGCIDLSNPQYARDQSTLLPGCNCLSCKDGKHTRAYIHHLIQAKELLAEILLFGHNLHQILLLYKEISRAISMNQLEKFCLYIESQL